MDVRHQEGLLQTFACQTLETMDFDTLMPSQSPCRHVGYRKVSPVSPSPVAWADPAGSTSLGLHSSATTGSWSTHGPRHERIIRKMCLRSFLRANGFKEGDIHTARVGGCFFKRESVYPIHVAAMQGDYDVMLLLLEEGADPEAETSRGRTALDCALTGCGSSQMTVKLLQQWLKK